MVNIGYVILALLLCFQVVRETQDSQRKHPEKKKYNKTSLYQEMGASRSTGFFISNDRAGAHCSSLNPGVTFTRVLPLCKCKFERKNIYVNT